MGLLTFFLLLDWIRDCLIHYQLQIMKIINFLFQNCSWDMIVIGNIVFVNISHSHVTVFFSKAGSIFSLVESTWTLKKSHSWQKYVWLAKTASKRPIQAGLPCIRKKTKYMTFLHGMWRVQNYHVRIWMWTFSHSLYNPLYRSYLWGFVYV